MLRWIVLAPLSLIASLICYLTNPIVLLFCNEDGELPSFLSLWQTWDNSCNPSDVTEHDEVPDWLKYDWARHYEEWRGSTPELSAQGRERWFTTCIDSNFSVVEQLKRYACRIYWLTRNCAYGWAFWPFGILPGINWRYERQKEDSYFVHADTPYWWLMDAWCYKDSSHWFSIWGYEVRKEFFLGWKVKPEARVDTRAMIATRLTVRIRKAAS